MPRPANATEYDFIIVGAGSSRLHAGEPAERGRARPRARGRAAGIAIPGSTFRSAWGRMMARRMHDWMYSTDPEPGMNGRRIEIPRGKVIGGSSSINAMAYVRGHRGDYDRWAAAGLAQWSYAHVLPYFRRQEIWEGGADQYRGGDGPLTTRHDPLCRSDRRSLRGRGRGGRLSAGPTTSTAASRKASRARQVTIRNGRRCSAAVAYLRPALGGANLRVEVGALVNRVLFDGHRAIGVEYVIAAAATPSGLCQARSDPRRRRRSTRRSS